MLVRKITHQTRTILIVVDKVDHVRYLALEEDVGKRVRRLHRSRVAAVFLPLHVDLLEELLDVRAHEFIRHG